MKLGICFNPPSGTLSGSQQTIADLLVPEIVRQHPDTIVFTASPERFEQLPPDRVVALPGRMIAGARVRSAIGMLRNSWSVPQLFERSGCDVVYYPYTFEVLHRPVSVRRVVTVHDLLPLVYPALYPRTVRLWRGKLMPTLRSVDAIITPSINTLEGLIAQGGFERRRIRVIHQGYRPVAARAVSGPPVVTGPYILYVSSSHYPYKNVAMLMRAFNHLGAAVPHRLVIVAKHDHRFTPALDVLRRSLPTSDRIVLKDEVTEDELRSLYQFAELFAYPSELEGFGIPPIEAMSAGVPVVASNAASIPEICGDGATYFPPWDEVAAAAAMLSVLSNETLRAAMRVNGYRQVARYSWARTATQIIALSREVHAWPAR